MSYDVVFTIEGPAHTNQSNKGQVKTETIRNSTTSGDGTNIREPTICLNRCILKGTVVVFICFYVPQFQQTHEALQVSQQRPRPLWLRECVPSFGFQPLRPTDRPEFGAIRGVMTTGSSKIVKE